MSTEPFHYEYRNGKRYRIYELEWGNERAVADERYDDYREPGDIFKGISHFVWGCFAALLVLSIAVVEFCLGGFLWSIQSSPLVHILLSLLGGVVGFVLPVITLFAGLPTYGGITDWWDSNFTIPYCTRRNNPKSKLRLGIWPPRLY